MTDKKKTKWNERRPFGRGFIQLKLSFGRGFILPKLSFGGLCK